MCRRRTISCKGHFPGFCGCEVCRSDVLVFALNRLPARYVASVEGKVVTEVNLEKDQTRVTIEIHGRRNSQSSA